MEHNNTCVILVLILANQCCILMFIYNADRRLKHVLKSGIKPVKMRTLTKNKYLFVFYRRKEGLITQHAYLYMIAYYFINAIGFTTMLIQYTTESNYSLTCYILASLHLVMFIAVSTQPSLNPVQQKMFERYMEGEPGRQCDRRADLRMEQIITTIINNDSETLKLLFSKKALDEAIDIDVGINTLFDFIQGDIDSWERGLVPFNETREFFRKRIMIRFTIKIRTDKDAYELFVIDHNADKITPNNEGIYMLEIRKSSYDIDSLQPWRERMCAGIIILDD